ncbi:hypothetical protein ACFWHH_39155, partial [Streptomyces massasporeus]
MRPTAIMVRTPDAGRRTPDAGRRTPDAGRRTPGVGTRGDGTRGGGDPATGHVGTWEGAGAGFLSCSRPSDEAVGRLAARRTRPAGSKAAKDA